jgi:hypothetical protein
MAASTFSVSSALPSWHANVPITVTLLMSLSFRPGRINVSTSVPT